MEPLDVGPKCGADRPRRSDLLFGCPISLFKPPDRLISSSIGLHGPANCFLGAEMHSEMHSQVDLTRAKSAVATVPMVTLLC